MSLPDWSEGLEAELRRVYFSAAPEFVEGSPSRHRGLKAVYAYVRDLAEGRAQWPPDGRPGTILNDSEHP